MWFQVIKPLKTYIYLVVKKKICESLHNAGEDHKDGDANDADDDVVTRHIFLWSSSRQHLEKQMPRSNLVSYKTLSYLNKKLKYS